MGAFSKFLSFAARHRGRGRHSGRGGGSHVSLEVHGLEELIDDFQGIVDTTIAGV